MDRSEQHCLLVLGGIALLVLLVVYFPLLLVAWLFGARELLVALVGMSVAGLLAADRLLFRVLSVCRRTPFREP